MTAASVLAADPDSFGRAMRFRDHVTLKTFYASAMQPSACNTATTNCAAITNGRIDFETLDAGSIRLPANSANSLLCPVVNNLTNYTLKNSGTAQTSGMLNILMTFTIESPALNDPSLINPLTGAAFNGKIVSRQSALTRWESLAANAQAGATDTTVSGASCSPNFLSRQSLRGAYGLPDPVARAVMTGPLTLRMGYKITATNANLVQYFPSFRLISD